MRSSGEAGGLKEAAKSSMSSRNLVAGMPRSFFPSVMESRLMLERDSSAPPWRSSPVSAVADLDSDDIVSTGCVALWSRANANAVLC